MKSIITVILASATLSWPGALSVGSQEATATQPPAVLQGTELDEEDLANPPAEVQQQVEVELRPELEAVVADLVEAQRVGDFASLKKDVAAVAVWTDTDLRRAQEQLAKAQQAIELAQAAAPAAPRASAGTAATPAPAPAPAPALSQRLQAIVSKGRGGPGKALVIRTSDADAKAQANLEEDLPVMSRILDKTVA